MSRYGTFQHVGRAPDGVRARSRFVHVRFDEDELKTLDRTRGPVSRSEFIRRAVREKTRQNTQPELKPAPEDTTWLEVEDPHGSPIPLPFSEQP